MTTKTTATATVNQAAKDTIIEAMRKNAQADIVDLMNALRRYQKDVKVYQERVVANVTKRITERSAELEAEIAAFEASV